MSNKTSPVKVRQAGPEDVPFIFNAWLKSFKNSAWCRNIPSPIYYAEHHKLIERLLKTCPTIVACNPDDLTQIYGFLCSDLIDGIFCLHYAYVKHSFRSLGIAKAMLNHLFFFEQYTASVYTHHTRIAEKLAPRYNLVYHPYLLINRSPRSEKKNEQL